jgi:hypothetical protein
MTDSLATAPATRRNPFGEIALTDAEVLDEQRRLIFPDGRRPKIDYGRFAPATFQRALTAVDLEFRRTGQVPAVREVYDSWPQVPLKTYSDLYAWEGFRDALRRRGMRTDDNLGLTEAKMRAIGLTYAVYQAWMLDPRFKSEFSRRANEGLQNTIPVAKQRLIANVEAGDARSIEYFLALTGVYSPALAANQDAMQVVYAVLRAVEKHVPDKVILQTILDEVKVAGKAFDLTHTEV